MGLALADFYARTDLAYSQFIALSRALAPIWLIGLWVTASLTWFGRSWVTAWISGSRSDDEWHHRALGMPAGAVLGLVSPFPLLSLTSTLGLLLQAKRSRSFAVGLALGSVMMSPAALTFGLVAMGIRLVILQVVIALIIACGAGVALTRMSPVSVLRSHAWPPRTEAKQPESQTLAAYFTWLGRHLTAMAPHFVLALLIVAWLTVILPANAVVRTMGYLGPFAVPAAAILGAGVHQCPSTLPVAAELFAQAGMSGGALLAYVTFGQVTTIRNLAGLSCLLKPRAIGILLGIALCSAILMGWLAWA